MIIAIQFEDNILYLSGILLDSNCKGFVRAFTFYAEWQITLNVLTSIRSVVVLIMFFVTKHVNTIEIRLIELVRLVFGITLLKDNPTARPSVLSHILCLC